MVGPAWNERIPGGHYTVCVGKSFFELQMYVESCCSGSFEGVQRKRGASCLEILQGDPRR